MLLRGGGSLTREEKALLAVFRALSPEDRRTLSDFAAFLGARSVPGAVAKPTEPVAIPRPTEESVIKAIKRLRATYPMLDQNRLLNDTSNQMTAHLIHGKPAAEIIDELEVVFSRHYRVYCEEYTGEGDDPSPPGSTHNASEA